MTKRFNLRDRDYDLMQAAISLGDWIKRQPECTKSDTAAINELQSALKQLPEPTLGRNLSYGVGMTNSTISLGWYASLERTSWSEQDLSIYSIWTPKDRILSSDTQQMISNELHFELPLQGAEFEGDFNFDRFADEVQRLDEFRARSEGIEIETESASCLPHSKKEA